jgi:G3E family GTPase
MKGKLTFGGLAAIGFICFSVPMAQAQMKNVPIQNLTLVQENTVKAVKAKKDHDDHHHHHDHHHHWHHHGVSGATSGTGSLPSPRIDIKG